MSPRRTFQSCGSSSRLVRRRKPPIRVTRGSPALTLNSGPSTSFRWQHGAALLLRADEHRAELGDLERRADPAAARLAVDAPGRGCRGGSRAAIAQGAARAGRAPAPETQTSKPRFSSRELRPRPHRRQRHDGHALDVVEDRVRGEDLEVARARSRPGRRAAGPCGPGPASPRGSRSRTRAGRGRSRARRRPRATSLGAPRIGPSSSSPRPLRKPTTSRPYSGWASSLRCTSFASGPLPTMSVRRGCIRRGKTQLRMEPRASGTSTSAEIEEQRRLDRRVDPPAGEGGAGPARAPGRPSEPASIAWKMSRTSSKLATEIFRLSFS